MTHYTRRYEGENADREAVRDAVEYWGFRQALRIVRILKNPNAGGAWSQDEWRIGLSFSGVQGFPVKALYERYTGRKWVH